MTDHWRIYEPIDDVVMFDADGVAPHLHQVQITANLSTADNQPDARIAIAFGNLASGSLTADQCAALREILERAEADVRRGADRDEECEP